MNVFQLYQDFNQNVSLPLENQRALFDELKDLYGFKNYESFSQRIKPQDYSSLKSSHFFGREQLAPYYVRTSGTNSPSKSIPVGTKFLRRNHQRASEQMFYNLVMVHKCVSFLMGKNMGLMGYKYSDTINGKEVFDISALMFHLRPKIYQAIGYPKGLYYNWEEKLEDILNNFSSIRKIRSLCGVPTWMISMFKYLEEYFQKPIRELLPHLQYIVHGGVKFDNYFPIFNKAFPDRQLRFFEVYNSTEAFHAFQLHEESPELLLCTNTGVFYEFLDGESIFSLAQIELGKAYEILMTNEDGLVRYRTGDVIEFSSLTPALFKFKGRTSEFINAFGEDLEIGQTNEVVAQLNREYDLGIHEYIVLPKYSTMQELGCHEWFLFMESESSLENQIPHFIDSKLQDLNNNYRQKRSGSKGILIPQINVLPMSSFKRLIVQQEKNGMGQSKIKRLHNDRKIYSLLQKVKRMTSNIQK